MRQTSLSAPLSSDGEVVATQPCGQGGGGGRRVIAWGEESCQKQYQDFAAALRRNLGEQNSMACRHLTPVKVMQVIPGEVPLGLGLWHFCDIEVLMLGCSRAPLPC